MFPRHRVLDLFCLVVATSPLACAQNNLQIRVQNAQAQSGNLPLVLPAAPVRVKRNDSRIATLQSRIRRAQIFAAYRQLTQIYIELGRYDDAAQTLRAEAAQYRRKGLQDAAIIQDNKAAQYQTDVRLFIDAPPPVTQSSTRLAPLEPRNGCYLGAFIDRDDALGRAFFDENGQRHGRHENWAQMTGKAHASYFMYLRYGQRFPRLWVDSLKRLGAIPQIAWEPCDLNAVRDDAYLRRFAREMARANCPVFVRFASEMNGFWTPYHQNPALYREKFRLVHRVLHQEAPLCATIWCVSNPPLGNIASYYPGDDGCDWVGVNFYSVPFHENDARQAAFDENPLALLDPIYKMFAPRKPIAICEYAASHRAAVDNIARPDFAIDKLSLLYGALPRLYPRVKLIDWFSMNTIRYATAGKTRSDYTLSGDNRVLDAYRSAVREPYFLSQWNQNAPLVPRPLMAGQTARNHVVLGVWAKTYVSRPKVYLQMAGKIVYASNAPGAHTVALDLRGFPKGRHNVSVFVFDDQNRFVRRINSFLDIQPELPINATVAKRHSN